MAVEGNTEGVVVRGRGTGVTGEMNWERLKNVSVEAHRPR
jgi:hypothetical protein